MKKLIAFLLLSLSATVGRPASPVPIVIDTDCSTDVGDLAAIASAAALDRIGYINLVAVTIDTTNTKSPGAAAATLQWWGVSPLPAIGAWKGATFDPGGPGSWVGYIYDNYPHTGVGLTSTVADATSVLRQALAARSAKDLVICCIGPLNNIATLLASSADGYSSLNGVQLVSAKVKAIYVAAGYFPASFGPASNIPEWNLQQDPTSAHTFITTWPSDTPIYFSGTELSDTVVVGANLVAKPFGDLMHQAYHQAGYDAGRPAWDNIPLLAACVQGAAFNRVRASITIDGTTAYDQATLSTTANTFYLRKTVPDSVLVSEINNLMGLDVTAIPLMTSWGGAPGIARVDFGN